MLPKPPTLIRHLALPTGTFALCIALSLGLAQADTDPVPVPQAQIEAGRAIYELGILPDGTPLRGIQPTGAVLEGTQAACGACHRRSGFGAFEGSIMAPPITGAVLAFPGPHFIAPGSTPTGAV